MSNTTARAAIHENIEYTCDEGLRVAVVLDCGDLAALAASDQGAAAAQLASLTAAQLVTQAQAYASHLNAKHQDDVTGAQVLGVFQRCIAKHFPEASAPAPEAAADHTDPDSMINVEIDPEATIELSESHGPIVPALPIIETLALDPSLIVALRLLLETQHPTPQFHRALNGDGRKRSGALRHLLDGTPFCFDPNARLLRIASANEPGRWYSTDGATCECKGAAHVCCWHRVAWHVVVLALALTDPYGLLSPAPLLFVAPQPLRLAA